jgi:hypothetical protein
VAKISTDVATLMQAMRSELYILSAADRVQRSGDGDVIEHFLTSFMPGAEVAFEVRELIKQRKLQHAAKGEIKESAAAS